MVYRENLNHMQCIQPDLLSLLVVLFLMGPPKSYWIYSSFPSRWVSGVGSVHHPMVWSACMAYANSTALSDRVWGEGGTFVSLVYCEGCTQPSFWECRAMPPPEGDHTKTEHFQIHTGEATIQVG